jgi:hypothetical protein
MKLAKFINSKGFNCSLYYKYKQKSLIIAYFKNGKEFFRSEIRKVSFDFIKKFGISDAEEILKNNMTYV